MITLGRYTNDQILPRIGFGKPAAMFDTQDGTFSVKVNGARLECLRRNQSCVWCHNTGTVWLLQRHQVCQPRVRTNCFLENCPWCSLRANRTTEYPSKAPHLNLYYKNRIGGLILMTRDHIHPRYRGGSNKIENSQTMCQTCNGHKGASLMSEFDERGHRKGTAA